MAGRAKQGLSGFVGKKVEQFHVGRVEGELLGKQPQDREYRYCLVRDTDRNKCLSFSHYARALAGSDLNMTLTAHHALKAGFTKGAQQVVLLKVDSEGPKHLKGLGIDLEEY